MKFKSAAAMALGLALIGGGLKADDAKAPAWYTNTTVHGYGDVNYLYNFNGLAPVGRVFDTTDQMFTVNGAKLAIANTDSASGTSGEIDLLYGPMAAKYNATAIASSMAIEQAFVTQAMGPVTFKLGKAGTFVGNEVTDTTGNFNYSRSILFNNEPFFNTGLSATYAITSSFSLMGYMGDGNSVDTGVADHPDFGAQIVFTGVKGLSLTGTYYDQPAGPFIYASNTTPITPVSLYTNIDMFNFVGSYQVMDSLAVVGEYLNTVQTIPSDASTSVLGSINAQGYALYLDYQTPIAGLKIDPRYEQFFTGSYTAVSGTLLAPVTTPVPAGQVNDFTLTVKYTKGPLTHYLEFRDDAQPTNAYYSASGVAGKPAGTMPFDTKMQNTLTYAATYSF